MSLGWEKGAQTVPCFRGLIPKQRILDPKGMPGQEFCWRAPRDSILGEVLARSHVADLSPPGVISEGRAR